MYVNKKSEKNKKEKKRKYQKVDAVGTVTLTCDRTRSSLMSMYKIIPRHRY